jgi:hypothetical protein
MPVIISVQWQCLRHYYYLEPAGKQIREKLVAVLDNVCTHLPASSRAIHILSENNLIFVVLIHRQQLLMQPPR